MVALQDKSQMQMNDNGDEVLGISVQWIYHFRKRLIKRVNFALTESQVDRDPQNCSTRGEVDAILTRLTLFQPHKLTILRLNADIDQIKRLSEISK